MVPMIGEGNGKMAAASVFRFGNCCSNLEASAEPLVEMTCREASFFGDIGGLRLDVYSVQEKKILCREKSLRIRSHGEAFGTSKRHGLHKGVQR